MMNNIYTVPGLVFMQRFKLLLGQCIKFYSLSPLINQQKHHQPQGPPFAPHHCCHHHHSLHKGEPVLHAGSTGQGAVIPAYPAAALHARPHLLCCGCQSGEVHVAAQPTVDANALECYGFCSKEHKKDKEKTKYGFPGWKSFSIIVELLFIHAQSRKKLLSSSYYKGSALNQTITRLITTDNVASTYLIPRGMSYWMKDQKLIL